MQIRTGSFVVHISSQFVAVPGTWLRLSWHKLKRAAATRGCLHVPPKCVHRRWTTSCVGDPSCADRWGGSSEGLSLSHTHTVVSFSLLFDMVLLLPASLLIVHKLPRHVVSSFSCMVNIDPTAAFPSFDFTYKSRPNPFESITHFASSDRTVQSLFCVFKF